jgi:hypothetical protein
MRIYHSEPVFPDGEDDEEEYDPDEETGNIR